ncbi:MAG TPA: TlpA disulfide reductase family protein [Pseudomonadales bacterium]|nr:TlpA disulfide reductase family protein [Pseudomonadales bacterium]
MMNIGKISLVVLFYFLAFPVGASDKNTEHDFSFPDAVSGKEFELGKQPAQWTLLAFWRVDCAPCIVDMPVLADFSAKNSNIRTLGISLSSEEETRQQWQKMAMPFQTLVNTGFPGELLEEYGNESRAVPFTVLLKPDRIICWSVVGKITLEKLQSALQQCQH